MSLVNERGVIGNPTLQGKKTNKKILIDGGKKNMKKISFITLSILLIASIVTIVPTAVSGPDDDYSVSNYQIISVAQTDVDEITVDIGGTYCPACNPNNAGNPGCPEFTHGTGVGGTWVPGQTGYYNHAGMIDGRYAAACIAHGPGPTYTKQKFICTPANWPLAVFNSHAFVFSGLGVSGGDTVTIYGELYCSWCGHWYAEPQELIVTWFVDIDIKPGSYPNSINLDSKGVVPVAILSSAFFDACTVDPDTVDFLGEAPLRWAIEDVDGDGDWDMILHFKTQDLDFSLLVDEGGDYPFAYLTGETNGGIPFEGKDTVRLLGDAVRLFGHFFEILEQLSNRFPIMRQIFGV